VADHAVHSGLPTGLILAGRVDALARVADGAALGHQGVSVQHGAHALLAHIPGRLAFHHGALRADHEPHLADVLAGRVTRHHVPDPVVQRHVVVGHLGGAIGALGHAQRSGDTFTRSRLLACRHQQRRPPHRAVVVAGAHARRVVGEEIQRHAIRPHQERPQLVVAAHGHGRRLDDEPHLVHVLARGVAGTHVVDPVVQRHVVERHLDGAIIPRDRAQRARQPRLERRLAARFNRQRRPVRQAVAGTVAHARRVIGEDVERHAVRADEERAKLVIAAQRHIRRLGHEPHVVHIVAGGVARRRIVDPVVEWHPVVDDLVRAVIGALDHAQPARNPLAERGLLALFDRQRRPVRQAVAGAVAHARRVVGEDVKRHPRAID